MQRKTTIIGTMLTAAGIAIAAGALWFTPDAGHDYNYQYLADVGSRVAVSPDGSIYMAGTGESTGNGKDFILVKYNVAMGFQWDKHYDGAGNGDDVLTGLAIDHATGNVFISGTSPGVFGPSRNTCSFPSGWQSARCALQWL